MAESNPVRPSSLYSESAVYVQKLMHCTEKYKVKQALVNMINTINTLSIQTIPEESTAQWMDRKWDAWKERTASWWYTTWRNHSGCIILSVFVMVSVVVVVVVVLNQKTTVYPCALYGGTTLASDVSVECLQYLWDKSCPTHSYSFPASYMGWWRSSPQGTALVHCSSSPCGWVPLKT